MTHGQILRQQFNEACSREPTKFERSLINWVRWNNSDYGIHGHCFSVEYRYIALSAFNSGILSVPVDVKDAELFDRGYRELFKLCEKGAYVIKASFINRESIFKIARHLQCNSSQVSNKLHQALKLLEKCLQTFQGKV